jgi:hypothetical protein
MISNGRTAKRQQAGALQTGRRWIWLVAIALFLVHHDFWWWDDTTIVFGFLPVGLAYHVGYSLAAAALWALVIKFAWPAHLEEFAAGRQDDAKSKGRS